MIKSTITKFYKSHLYIQNIQSKKYDSKHLIPERKIHLNLFVAGRLLLWSIAKDRGSVKVDSRRADSCFEKSAQVIVYLLVRSTGQDRNAVLQNHSVSELQKVFFYHSDTSPTPCTKKTALKETNLYFWRIQPKNRQN